MMKEGKLDVAKTIRIYAIIELYPNLENLQTV
jgi:hypothetical protein